MVTAFSKAVEGGLHNPLDLDPDAQRARLILQEGLGLRGREIHGELTATLNPAYVADNAAWFLNS
jgi:hypothetical protein